MWKQLKIAHQTYFIYCNINNTQDVSFILYDLKTTWSQTLTFQDVKKNVKLLNKRFDFNDDNIKEALMSGYIQSAVLEGDLNQGSCLLKIKYSVKNCLLNYEWPLRKQNLIEFQQTFVEPLLLAILGCRQQVETLTDIICKKDIELKQFRVEGAVLSRKTLATKPFDFEDFNKKFEDCNNTAISFREIAKYIKENDSKEKPEVVKKQLNVNKTDQDSKPKGNLEGHQNANTKMSPRQKKRKVNDLKMQHLEQHLKLRKRGLEYESSQSQTISSGNSQTIEEAAIKDLKQPQKGSTKTAKNEITLSPRRSSRCVSTKQYYMSSEHETDTDSEGHLETFTHRKRTRSLINLPKETNRNFNNGQTNSNSKNNNALETKQKCLKSSLSLSNVCRTKSPENSNVFDFSNDSEDDRNNLQKNKSERDVRGSKRIKLSSTNNSSVLHLNKDSESLNNISPASKCLSVDNIATMSSPSHKSLSHSPTPVIINEISSQLDNIKKELQTLEAMRLADLKQRMCKV